MSRVSYSRETVNTAFLMWFEVCKRDCKKVAALLRDDEVYREQAGLLDRSESPGADTIKRWEREEFWELKAADLMREAAPWRAQVAGIRMAYMTQKAAEVLDDILEKPVLTPGDKIRADNARWLIERTVGDTVAGYMKPHVEEALAAENLETIEDIRAAEMRALKQGSE